MAHYHARAIFPESATVSEALNDYRAGAGSVRTSTRFLSIFAAWRLQVYGYALAAVYAASFFYAYKGGIWLVDSAGTPHLTDFTAFWIAGTQALRDNIAALYDSVAFAKIQAAVVGPDHPKDFFYPNCPYPPTFFLVLAPLAMLSYVTAFLSFQAMTLLGCAAVVFLIVRRPPAIGLVLASPFSAFNFAFGQTGFLRASLVGAALLALERRPILAGVFIGCLTYKPQFGILIPVALVAGRQWRAVASAVITAILLAGISIAAFGIDPWQAFPRELLAQAGDYLLRENPLAAPWAAIQTVYGAVRAFHGSAALAWLAQGCATAGVAVIVWVVWRSPVRYALKAATLSAATLIATPYAWHYDLTVIAIPLAFLAKDQMRCELLRGEQAIIIALFGAALAILVCGGGLPLGPVVVITLVGVILRRVIRDGGEPGPAADGAGLLETSRGMPRRAPF
jgi:arabinofuranan 3-O-arabinosyltransferase